MYKKNITATCVADEGPPPSHPGPPQQEVTSAWKKTSKRTRLAVWYQFHKYHGLEVDNEKFEVTEKKRCNISQQKELTWHCVSNMCKISVIHVSKKLPTTEKLHDCAMQDISLDTQEKPWKHILKG
jgi:hypothetical protein